MPIPDTSRHTPASMDANPNIEKRASHCFGCGPANPQGLHLVFTTDTSNPDIPVATTQFQLDRLHEGPPGYIHGGIVATLLDEAMSKLNRPLNVLAMTRHMEIDYLHPVPLYQSLVLTSRHLSREGRKLFHRAEIQRPDGTVLARAKGLFIVIDARLLALAGLTQPES
ncbi:acyl-coenzyme A thioesterase PaaI-like protein [Edaphobacter aggregans]|uniref:Acyl-coenzyme A thioesterase THEM4 n=1 Tax=Edaphobacter aggregans TaxID=570835 RepID=A0A428MCU4_9BACT|nr:PaaI family thioesterase [Edaphobacter aggregans]RSL14730.1 acyl-coenzyme A thioesterase PaaI-like protein [Edaphobacter aggregans]